MKIGELAAAANTAVETIRYYERGGLLPAPARTGSNYRSYGADHLARLQFIRCCRGLDMSLEEIRLLLQFKDAPGADCGKVNDVLEAHMAHVRERIRELRSLASELKALRAQCRSSGAAQECGILEGLARAGSSPCRPRGAHLKGVHRTA